MLWEKVEDFWQDEEGLGTLEILLIVVVLVSVALMFRKQLINWITDILKSTDSGVQDGMKIHGK